MSDGRFKQNSRFCRLFGGLALHGGYGRFGLAMEMCFKGLSFSSSAQAFEAFC